MGDELSDTELDERVARALKWKKQGNAWFTPQGFYFGLSPRTWSIRLNAALELWAKLAAVKIQVWHEYSVFTLDSETNLSHSQQQSCHRAPRLLIVSARTQEEAARLLTEMWLGLRREPQYKCPDCCDTGWEFINMDPDAGDDRRCPKCDAGRKENNHE